MVTLPDSLYEDYSRPKLTRPSAPSTTMLPPPSITTILQWINDFQNAIPFISDSALHNLSIEVIKIYPRVLAPAHFQEGMPLRVYNILLLFQCIAHNRETRGYFLKAKMPHYFLPLMNFGLVDKPLECIRLGALGVIAHMLKAPVEEACVRFLLDSGALECCTKAIEFGSTESKTIAVFILNKTVSTDEGLEYCCALADRFYMINGVLKKLLAYMSTMAKPSPSLFNLIVGCYVRLSLKYRARQGLNHYLPVTLLDGTFVRLLAEDPVAANNYDQLMKILGIKRKNVAAEKTVFLKTK